MCGIVGYIGTKRRPSEELVEALKFLEYRGYDSAGIATRTPDGFVLEKAEGRISNLEQKINRERMASMGIAHTRWATHGEPSEYNAHPHVSENDEWVLVHNGIVDNFGEIKQALINEAVRFVSQTDTEVAVQLLARSHEENKLFALIDTCSRLRGSWAFACMNKRDADRMYLARKKSPLYVAIYDGEVFVASDPICFNSKAQEYYSLEDDEFCSASSEGLHFYNALKEEISKNSIPMDKFDVDCDKADYEFYMEKEIAEVPHALSRVAKTYADNNVFEYFTKENLEKYNRVHIIGCGTAYHAGLMGAKYIQKFARIEANAFVASEYRYSDPIIDEKTLCIFVSQSGETADTLAALELARSKGAKIVALTNVLYSTIAKNAEIIFPVCAGPEIAVASTKAYTCQIAAFYLFASHLRSVLTGEEDLSTAKLMDLSKRMKMPGRYDFGDLVDELAKEEKVFFIGRDRDYITAEEASLKLKEITYINSSAYPSGELKHGFLALIEKGTFLFVDATNRDLLDKTINGAHEASCRGARLVVVSQLDIPKEQLQDVYLTIKLPSEEEDLMPIVSIGVFQMLAFLVSEKKGLNPDKPRNLAKSVTVD